MTMKRPSHQKVFAARIKAEVLPDLEDTYGEYEPLNAEALIFIDRLCDDPRMQSVWPLLSKADGDTFCHLFDELYCVACTIGWRSVLMQEYKEQRDGIATLLEAFTRLTDLCRTVNISLSGPPFRIKTVADLRPEIPELLEYWKTGILQPGILQRAEVIAEMEKREFGNLSRKYNEGRHDAIQSIAHIMRNYLGKPCYAAAAAIANVLLDTGANDEITADAVRKFVARKKPDNSLE
jgi:hypothetical protein